MLKRIAFGVSLVSALALAGTAFAGGGANKSSSSIRLVVMNTASSTTSAAAGPRWADQVTFDVSTTADYPSVVANCYQNGSLVYRQFGFFYPAPQTPTFKLQSYVWAGGAADCTAELYTMDAKKGTSTTLATTSFHVDA
jgi:hypothetical protein